MAEVACAICGKLIERAPWQIKRNKSGNFFCGQECYSTWRSKRWGGDDNPNYKPKVEVTCDYCGTSLERHPYRLRAKHQFCDAACKGQWMSRNQKGKSHPRYNSDLSVECDWCGNEFRARSITRVERNERNFCSLECCNEWRASGIYAGENNPQWKPPVRKPCDNCGKVIERPPSRVGETERTHHFCSKDCRYEWMSGYMSGPNSPNWGGGTIGYRGPNWVEQAHRARKRDGYKCRHCGISQKKLSRKLDVHHVIPFRQFGYIYGENDNYKQANRLSNLISLCPSCHHRAEQGSIPVQPNLV